MSPAIFVIRDGHLWRAKRLDAIALVLLLGALAAVATVGVFMWNVERHRRTVDLLEQRSRKNSEMLALLRQRVAAAQASSHTALTPETVRQSLRRFEQTYLPHPDVGLSQVLTEVNRIARESGLMLSSDIMFTPMEEVEIRAGTSAPMQSGGRGIYPGVRLSFTVNGEYANVRRFLAALESSPLLLIVEGVTLKSVEERTGARPTTASGGSISLEITVSAYFRRSEGETS